MYCWGKCAVWRGPVASLSGTTNKYNGGLILAAVFIIPSLIINEDRGSASRLQIVLSHLQLLIFASIRGCYPRLPYHPIRTNYHIKHSGMNYFKKFKSYLREEPSQVQPSSNPAHKPQSLSKSNQSFELIMMDILEDSEPAMRKRSSDLEKSNEYYEDLVFPEDEHEELENIYMRDFIFVNKLQAAREVTEEEWAKIIAEGNLSLVPKKNVYFSIFKGIKFSVRKGVWQLFANTPAMKKLTNKSYKELAQGEGVMKQTIVQIDKDVPRSRSTTKYLDELRNILIAYCSFSGKIYTQGMNLIAGSLLTLLALQNDEELEEFTIVEKEFEERVFWVFIGVMVWKDWQSIFTQNLEGLTDKLKILENLMINHVPAVYQKIVDFEWDLTIFSQYYITIMLYNTPVGFSKIILDLFFLDGENVIHSLIIRMMKLQEEKILGCMDEGQIMNYFKKDMIADTYASVCRNQIDAQKLEDFQINFMKVNK